MLSSSQTSPRRRRSACLVLLIIAAGLCLSLTSSAPAGPLSELILFTLREDTSYRIYSMRPDGNELARIAKVAQSCREPNMCPATGEIAFSAFDNGCWTIYVLNPSTHSINALVKNYSNDRHPVWSPDGTQVVFETDRWGSSEIALYDRTAQVCHRLTYNQSHNSSPAWSSDGKCIAYTSWLDSIANIFVIDFKSASTAMANAISKDITSDECQTERPQYSIKRITKGHYPCTQPCWDPTGQKLAFASQDYYRPYLATTDMNHHIATLRPSSEWGQNPAWSPDGSSILYILQHNKDQRLMIHDLESGTSREFPRQFEQRVYDLVWQRRPLPWSLPAD